MFSAENFERDLYERPDGIDLGSFLRIRQIRPVERAAAPLIDHNIELIQAALSVRDWYLGKTTEPPAKYMSLQLDPTTNAAAKSLVEFCQTVKAFAPGDFPGHCHAVRELEFTTKYLIKTLSGLIDSNVFCSALKQLGTFFAAISDPASSTMSRHDFEQRLDSRLDLLIKSFAAISRIFAQREREIVFAALPAENDTTHNKITLLAEKTDVIAAKTTDILNVTKSTRKIVGQINKRDIKRGKREQETEKQEACFRYWEIGRGKSALIMGSNSKVTYKAVYDYFKREFEELGIKSAAELVKHLRRRAKRLSIHTRRTQM